MYSVLLDVEAITLPFSTTLPSFLPSLDHRFGDLKLIMDIGTFVNTTSTTGAIHIYRNLPSQDQSDSGTAQASSMICVLACPNWLSNQDFLKLMGPNRLKATHILIINDNVPNRYMIIIKFDTCQSANDFYSKFNGVPFNSFEPEVCHLVFVHTIFVHERNKQCRTISPPEVSSLLVADTKTFIDDNTLTTLVELPTCPVCLERLDSTITGLLTSICRHTFHCNCIVKWGHSSCPVCRYSSLPNSNNNVCSECSSTENLWICLICAHVGCGRYIQKHAYKHYQSSNHMYSLELETQRVWDYSGDGYVHRLIQSNTDGKLIQLPAVNPNPSPHIFRLGLDSLTDAPLVTQNDGIVSEKVEMIGIDYANLLNQQLARQQEWFEHQLSKIEALNCEQISILIGENEHNRNNYLMLKHQIAALEGETKQKDAKIEKLTKKLVECNQQISELDSDLSEEKTMNNGMVENQKYLQGKIKELEDGVCQKDNEMEELKDQLRDLMFFLDTQSKVADNEELKEAVVVGVSTKESPKKGGRKKR